MSDNRLTVRFSDDEMSKLMAHAKTLDMSKTDVVRLAIQGLFSASRTVDKLDRAMASMRADFGADIDSRMKGMEAKQRRANLLLLKVLQAPKEAEAALETIYKT